MRPTRSVSDALFGAIVCAAVGCGGVGGTVVPGGGAESSQPPVTPGDASDPTPSTGTTDGSEAPTYGARVVVSEGQTELLSGRADLYVVDAEPETEGACVPSTMVQFAGPYGGVQASWLVLGRSLSTSDVVTSTNPRRSMVNVTIEAGGEAARAYASSVRIVEVDEDALTIDLLSPTLCRAQSVEALDAIPYWPTDAACTAKSTLTLVLNRDAPQATALCGKGESRYWKIGDDDLCWTLDVRDCVTGRDIRTGELPPDPTTDQD